MMKKLIALVLALCMVFALCACGTKSETPDNTAKANVKIGVICLHDENSSYDRNFIDAAKEVFKEMGLTEDQYMFKTGVGEDQSCYDAAAELADAGCTAVFSDSYGHESYMIQAAKDFPKVQFVSATADRAHTEKLANFHNAFADIYMGRYLAGVAADLGQQWRNRVAGHHQQGVQQVHGLRSGVAVGQCETQCGRDRVAAHGGQLFSVHQTSSALVQ